MKISFVRVSNYRNIDKIGVVFHPECNYVIGENNLGKSNFLSLLATVCSGKAFDDQDFANPEKPIDIEIDIRMFPNEIGFFGDNFSPDDASLLRIRYYQTMRDAYPTIVSVDSNEGIQPRQIRKITFLKYETTSVPSKELRLDSKKGVGLLVGSMIERFNDTAASDFLNEGLVNELRNTINGYLKKIPSFRDYSIEATVSPEVSEMLARLFYLSDGDRKIETTGSGVQYIAMASINILAQIMDLYKSKAVPFSERLYTNIDGKKLLPLVLAVDEPEVHLHPYLQRSLIAYYKKILCNKDPDFIDLLNACFGIDGIDGQLIIVTHSTDALVGDYRNMIRFYKRSDITSVVSGYDLRPIPKSDNKGRIKTDDEKHLIMHFPEIKEAFYAKCAILFEGETEYGCIRAFADTIGVSLDDFGICVINAGGETAINRIRQLLAFFAIPSVAIYDGDVKDGHSGNLDEFFTSEACFEIEIVKTLFNAGKQKLIRQIAHDVNNTDDTFVFDAKFIKKYFKKTNVDTNKYQFKRLSDVSDNNEEGFCAMFSAWFIANKGVILGRIVGEALAKEDIPDCYKNAIRRAQEVAKDG